MHDIESVKEARQAELLAIPGVVGVGIVSGPLGEPVIAVYVAHRSAAAQIPKMLEGYPVSVEVSGEFDALLPR